MTHTWIWLWCVTYKYLNTCIINKTHIELVCSNWSMTKLSKLLKCWKGQQNTEYHILYASWVSIFHTTGSSFTCALCKPSINLTSNSTLITSRALVCERVKGPWIATCYPIPPVLGCHLKSIFWFILAVQPMLFIMVRNFQWC